jgi:hypothetical protein
MQSCSSCRHSVPVRPPLNRLKVLGRLQLLAAMQNFDTFAGGATLSFTL